MFKIDNRVKVFRKKNNLSQKELASLVGTKRETINRLENGLHNPSLVLALNIAKVLNP